MNVFQTKSKQCFKMPGIKDSFSKDVMLASMEGSPFIENVFCKITVELTQPFCPHRALKVITLACSPKRFSGFM